LRLSLSSNFTPSTKTRETALVDDRILTMTHEASAVTVIPARPTFAGIPQELRQLIYQLFLEQHYCVKRQTQPTNDHLRLLRTCRFVYNEAHNTLWRYLSLQTEAQITAFVDAVDDRHAQHVEWADVACDNRVYRDPAETAAFTVRSCSFSSILTARLILPAASPGVPVAYSVEENGQSPSAEDLRAQDTAGEKT
jgi:hypothetical protein